MAIYFMIKIILDFHFPTLKISIIFFIIYFLFMTLKVILKFHFTYLFLRDYMLTLMV